MLRTKIVCTIGPATRSAKMLRELMIAGMNVARLNLSHADRAEHSENILRIREMSASLAKPVAIMVDLQGPKLRIGKVDEDGILLRGGETVVLTTRETSCQEGCIPLQYDELPRFVTPGERILLDDGLLELNVLATSDEDITCQVVTGGLLKSNKGMNLPQASLSIPTISEKDEKDLRAMLEQQVDWIALSFVRSAQEVLRLKELIEKHSILGLPTPVVAKIEKPEAVDAIDAIITVSDGIMVARGDLGVETCPEAVPMTQKMIIRKCNEAGKPVITATQMLDSMIRNPRPTRAEASDVANAILDGTDAVMLSGETAVGKYPIETVRTMVRIAEHTEERMDLGQLEGRPRSTGVIKIAEAVSHATCATARELGAVAIMTPTVSGHTARMVAKYRPSVPIVAVTPSPRVQRQLTLYWGVHPVLSARADSTDEMIASAVRAAVQKELVHSGDVIVITGGTPGGPPGTTNLMKVQVAERILARGVGIGELGVVGRARILKGDPARVTDVESDEIIVIQKTTKVMACLMQRAAGVIAVEKGVACPTAILAVELGIPAIIGVEDALSAFRDGEIITLDPVRGVVYQGNVRV